MIGGGQTPKVDDELGWFPADILQVERRNGVPVVHVPAPGPVRGGIMFRVGVIDELLTQRGLTHMVEHLALYGQLGPSDHKNGSTGGSITQFFAAGSEEQVVEFLNHVCTALRDLPVHRLEAERSILRVEAQRRQASIDAKILEVRYGADSFARSTFHEFATDTATAEQVTTWANSWFVQGNAVAWITTDVVPASLDLSLREGGRRPAASPQEPLRPRPLWFDGQAGAALVEAVVARSTAAVVFTEVLSKALFRQLRLERGLSYSASAQYEPLDADHARILIYADSARESTTEFVDALCDLLMSLRDGVFEHKDVDAAREQARENARQTALVPESLLATVGFDYLLGGEAWHLDAVAKEREAITEADLAAAAREFWKDAIWQTPSMPPEHAEIAPYPTPEAVLVTGLSYFHMGTNDRFVFGDKGVSLAASAGTWTVLFTDCVLALRWEDGGRLLVGRDGTMLSVEPSGLSLFDARALARLDGMIPKNVIVSLPARFENVATAAGPVRPKPGAGDWALMLAFVGLLIGGSFAALFVGWSNSLGQLDSTGAVITIQAVVGVGVTAVSFVGAAAALTGAWVQRIRWNKQNRERP